MQQEDKIYTQTELANIIGVSKSTISRWLSKNKISPQQIVGNKKFYDETIIKKYNNKSYNISDKKSNRQSVQQSNETTATTATLVQQQKLIDEQAKEIKEKDAVIKEFGLKFAQLADQAQKLNLADKSKIPNDNKNIEEIKETKKETKKNSFWNFFKK